MVNFSNDSVLYIVRGKKIFSGRRVVLPRNVPIYNEGTKNNFAGRGAFRAKKFLYIVRQEIIAGSSRGPG